MRQRAAVVMRENGDPVVLLSLAEYESSPETLHLLRDLITAERLLRSIEEAEARKFVEHDVDEPPRQCHL